MDASRGRMPLAFSDDEGCVGNRRGRCPRPTEDRHLMERIRDYHTYVVRYKDVTYRRCGLGHWAYWHEEDDGYGREWRAIFDKEWWEELEDAFENMTTEV